MSKRVIQIIATFIGLSIPMALAADDAPKSWVLERQDRLGRNTTPILGHSSNSWKMLSSSYFFSEKVDLPIGALNFLSTFYGTPNFGGIPLGCNLKLSNGEEVSLFSTTSVKRTLLPISTFAAPIGYSTAPNLNEVKYGHVNARMEDLLKDMKVGEDFGNK